MFSIPAVFRDYASVESIDHALDALMILDQTIDAIFKTVTNRIAESRSEINKVRDRVGVCQDKVKKITGNTTATTVYSNAKFPASKELPRRQTTLHELE